MWSDQICGFMKSWPKTCDQFLGTFAADRLPSVWNQREDRCLVANTEIQSREGRHWVAFFLQRNGHVEYFDSYGLPPTVPEFVQFLRRHAKSWNYNNLPRQGLGSDTCGHHCLFYLWHRCHGLTSSEVLHLLDRDPAKNDDVVRSFVKRRMPGRVQREHKVNLDLRRAVFVPRHLTLTRQRRRRRKIFGKGCN